MVKPVEKVVQWVSDVSRTRGLGAAALFVALFILCPLLVRAQLYTASLSGVVQDASGAVIPQAKVVLTDQVKGTSYSTITSVTGRYVLLTVPPSTYILRVEARGFKTYLQRGITLVVKQRASVNVVLEVGSVTQTVNVSGAPPILHTSDAVTGQEVGRSLINDLPLNGRQAYGLVYLAPGVTQPATGTASIPVLTPIEGSSGSNFVSNGGRNLESDVLLDGVTSTVTDYQVRYPAYMPSVDAIQEFKVEQNNFSADQGYSNGTIINVILRSGTDKIHGSLYEFFRNSALDSNNWFNNSSNIGIPPLRYNDFGGTVGGPIRKDKAFFFFDYEGSRKRTLTAQAAGVPSVAERRGDFGELCGGLNGPAPDGTFNAQGLCSDPNGQIWDPYSGVFNPSLGGPVRQAFVPFNNMATYESAGSPVLNGTPLQLPAAPGNLIDPVAQKMLSFLPLPNVAVGTSAYNPYDNWAGSGAGIFNNNQYDVKMDQNISEKMHLSERFSSDWGLELVPQCWTNPLDPCSSGRNLPGATSIALNGTYNLSSNKLLTLSYGFVRGGWVTSGVAGMYPDFNPITALGLPSYLNAAGSHVTPVISFGQYVSAGPNNLGQQGWSNANMERQTHDVLASLDYIAGRHEFKFGGEMRISQDNSFLPCCQHGMFSFDQFGTSEIPGSGGGDSLATFLTGTSTDGSGEIQIPYAPAMTSRQYSGYALDNWKVSGKLNLNAGLRYDVEFPLTERHNALNYFDPIRPSPLKVPSLPDLKGGDVFVTPSDRSYVPVYLGEWQPRIGLAYRMTPSTVFRAGYGIFYGVSSYDAGSPGFQPGEDGFQTSTNTVDTYQNDLATPGFRLSNPFPNGFILPSRSTLGALTNVGFQPSGPIRAWNTPPQLQTWSAGFQRQLPGQILLDGNYVGTKGTHLIFAGFTNLNILGPSVESLPASGITELESLVPNPLSGIITNLSSPLSASTVPDWQLQLPSPQFTGESLIEPPWANSFYNAFELKVEKRFSHGLDFLFTYTAGKSIDDSSVNGVNWTYAGGSNHIQDPNRLYLERSLSDFDVSRLLQLSYVYQLPLGQGKRWGASWPAWEDALLGGWQTNGIWLFETGQPIPLTLSGGVSLPTYGPQQPNLLVPLQRNHSANWMTQYFANPQAAVAPNPFALGDGPPILPNVRAPGASNADISLFKEVPLNKLHEGAHLEFRAEFFNAFNHPRFAAPNSVVNSGTFGLVTSQYNSPREVQFGLKLYW